MARECSMKCGHVATRYAMDTCADGWADWYCLPCTPNGWWITDIEEEK